MAKGQTQAIAALVRDPRPLVLIRTWDATEHTFFDDGASVTNDGVFPNGRRQHLLNTLAKTTKGPGKKGPEIPAFVLKEIPAAMYVGDPLPKGPTYAAYADEIKARVGKVQESLAINKNEIESIGKDFAAAKEKSKELASKAKGGVA